MQKLQVRGPRFMPQLDNAFEIHPLRVVNATPYTHIHLPPFNRKIGLKYLNILCLVSFDHPEPILIKEYHLNKGLEMVRRRC